MAIDKLFKQINYLCSHKTHNTHLINNELVQILCKTCGADVGCAADGLQCQRRK